MVRDEELPVPRTRSGRLESWKEIAGFFARSVRTVQRWERELGLPVYRHRHNEGASIYAQTEELERWRRSRSVPSGASIVRAGHHSGTDAAGTSNTIPLAKASYLKGLHYFTKRTQGGLLTAVREFHHAIDEDPLWAAPHTALAQAYLSLSGNEFWAPPHGYPKARAAAERALERNPVSPDARTILGVVRAFYDGDLTGGASEIKQVIAAHPQSAMAHYYCGMVMLNIGRFEEATRAIATAAELEPLSPIVTANVGRPFLYSDDPARALPHFRRAVDTEPDGWLGHLLLGWALQRLSRHEEAEHAFTRAAELSDNHPGVLVSRAQSLAVRGQRQEARCIVAGVLAARDTRYVSYVRVARFFAAAGRQDRALRWLTRAARDRSLWNNGCIAVDPDLTDVVSHPAFRRELGARELGYLWLPHTTKHDTGS
jgi:Flp pilus assembly protein TadD